jgi:uncharacterized Zn finger protein
MPATICPFCQSRHVRILRTEGVRLDMVLFECEECERTWSEIVSLEHQFHRSKART